MYKVYIYQKNLDQMIIDSKLSFVTVQIHDIILTQSDRTSQTISSII